MTRSRGHTSARTLLFALACSGVLAGCGPTLQQAPTSAADVLEYAVRARARARVFAGDSVADGRVASLANAEFRVAQSRVSAGSVDSVFLRKQGVPPMRNVVAGIGVGTMAGLVTQFILGSLTFPIGTTPAWAIGGGIIGGAGVLIVTADAETTWERRWPPPDTLP